MEGSQCVYFLRQCHLDVSLINPKTILINKDIPENIDAFDEFYQGLAEKILPLLI